MAELQTYFATHTPAIRAAIEEIFDERRRAAEPLTSHLVDTIDTLSEFSLRGGKFVRSTLTLLGAQLAGAKMSDALYQVAGAVELFHKHLLNIDDMADRDELRYGGPTIWKDYENRFSGWKDVHHHGQSMAMMDGTLLGSFAFELVRRCALSAEQRLAIMDILNNRMYFETVAGWQIHYYQNHESLAEAEEADFLKGLDLVTSRYTFVGPLQIGLIAAGSQDASLKEILAQFGLRAGMAFQLTDDVLGLFGDPKETGKAVGNDVREGKKTLLLQRAYRAASTEDQKFLVDVCGRDLSDGELERIQTIVKETGAFEDSQKLAEKCVKEAVLALEKFETTTPSQQQAKTALGELAQSIVNRKK